MPTSFHIFGIRHHGPGSARTVLRALDEVMPDCVLIEGPPDADGLIAQSVKKGMTPPVAILVHDAARPSRAVYYPFAEFSPEWQAMRWAVEHGVAARFMDLPQSHRMAIDQGEEPESDGEDGGDEPGGEMEDHPPEAIAPELPEPPATRGDPLQQLAEAAGYDDGERWWEHVVETRRDHGAAVFQAIREAMAELRSNSLTPRDADEPQREAWMRKTMREAVKEGFANIAVVCGAWHAPALDVEAITKKQDDETLKGLTKVKTASTWVPWTYDRLTFASGYGAGVLSPGWYEHLWHRGGDVLESWMTRVARLLREKDIDCSSAHVIEAVRLSETLATMRGRSLADLSDIADATRAIFCFDSDLAMRLIGRELLVGLRIGEVPDDTPMVPLQQDLLAQQKRLRMKPEAQEKDLDLDLRNENDRERSVLLHRLRILDIDWGDPVEDRGGKGTFHELWKLRWDPGYTIKLIEAGVFGTTIADASGAKLSRVAREATDLRELIAHVKDAMHADLGIATVALVRQIQNIAAVSADVSLLMETLPSLASLIRYGNVRQTDASMVRGVVDGMSPRITAGLGGAVASLNDEAAERMAELIRGANDAFALLEAESILADWHACLQRVLPQDSVHGLVRGTAARLLLDATRLDADAVATLLSQALSRGSDPAQSARWVEGLLRGSGLLLIHDPKLLSLVDDWLMNINADVFQEVLPLLRRTFTNFAKPERRQIGQIIKSDGKRGTNTTAGGSQGINHERAARVLPALVSILGGAK